MPLRLYSFQYRGNSVSNKILGTMIENFVCYIRYIFFVISVFYLTIQNKATNFIETEETVCYIPIKYFVIYQISLNCVSTTNIHTIMLFLSMFYMHQQYLIYVLFCISLIQCAHGMMSLARCSVHGVMSLSQWSVHRLNDILPCAGKRVNNIMPCAQRIYIQWNLVITRSLGP